MQALQSQYKHSEGYSIRNPKLFKLRDPGDGSDPCLSIEVEGDPEKFIMTADPSNRQVSNHTIHKSLDILV